MAIARALSYDANIILADEPTGNLDHETQNEIMNIFRKLADEGKCVILVSHSMDVAGMCDETYELKRIRKQKKQITAEILENSYEYSKIISNNNMGRTGISVCQLLGNSLPGRKTQGKQLYKQWLELAVCTLLSVFS